MRLEIVSVALEVVLTVRVAAFSSLDVSPGGRNPEDDDTATLHIGVRVDSVLVCVATLTRQQSPRSPHRPAWRIRGMATLPDHQGHGHGGRLLQHGLDHI